VIDVTNFSPKTDYQGSRENLHLVERWTRTGPTTLEYVVTIEDPTVWNALAFQHIGAIAEVGGGCRATAQ
jgi:hypothetical protein